MIYATMIEESTTTQSYNEKKIFLELENELYASYFL